MSTARAFRRRRTLIGALLALALIGAACSSGGKLIGSVPW